MGYTFSLFEGWRCRCRGKRVRLIQVRERVDEWGKFGPPKSQAGIRGIPLSPLVIETLKSWQTIYPNGELDLVFPNANGRVQSQSNIYGRVFVPLMINCNIVKDSGKAHFNFYALRHAAASLLIEQGLTPKRIQTIMGHSTITMTFDTYGHLWNDPEADKKAFAEIESRLFES